MRLVRDGSGTRYEVRGVDDDGWHLTAVVSGRETTLEPASLEPVSLSPIEERGLTVDPETADRLGVDDPLGLGLLSTLADRGPTRVATLLAIEGPCEQELAGRAADLRVAGLVRQETIDGASGYGLTERAASLLTDQG